MRFRLPTLILSLAATAMILASCEGTHVRHAKKDTSIDTPDPSHKQGPPPHAPAHGYRAKHDGKIQLTYNKEISAYVVLGYTDYYYCNSSYFRLRGSSWEMSLQIDGPWQVTSPKKLPHGLKKIKVHKG